MGLQRISVEEAKQYVSLDNDYTGRGLDIAKYFTITPSDRGDGWETVTYYTGRKIHKYIDKEGDYDSWVYVLSNPTMPGTYKIGFTSKDPHKRAKELSNATGVALPYKVEYGFQCFNGYELEQEIHNFLDEYRVNSNREFFAVDFDTIFETIELIGKKYLK